MVDTAVGPAHKQPTVKERPFGGPAQSLVSTAVSPAHKQPAVRERLLVERIQPTVIGQWSGGPQVDSEVRGESFSPAYLASGQQVCSGGPGNRLEAVSCRAPEPLLGPPAGLGPGLEAVVNLFPLLTSDLMAVAVRMGHSLWALAPTIWAA